MTKNEWIELAEEGRSWEGRPHVEDDGTLTEDIQMAEGLLLQEQDEQARELLARLADDAEEYVDANCPTTGEVQWFSFPTMFDRLAYRRVESDPRELHNVGEPLDRLYSDLALADVRTGDYDNAMEALKSAIRWNPMDCESRLNLASLYRNAGDMHECLALTYSVFERASDPRHLARAYLTFANWFESEGNHVAAASALRAARQLDVDDSSLAAALDQAEGTEHDPDSVSEQEATDALATEGLPYGANAEIAICLLMCATDAAGTGDKAEAATLVLRARDLVGEEACKTLLRLIRESDAEASEGGADHAGQA